MKVFTIKFFPLRKGRVSPLGNFRKVLLLSSGAFAADAQFHLLTGDTSYRWHSLRSASRESPGTLSALRTRRLSQSFCSARVVASATVASNQLIGCRPHPQPPMHAPLGCLGLCDSSGARRRETACSERFLSLLLWALHGTERLWSVVANTATLNVNQAKPRLYEIKPSFCFAHPRLAELSRGHFFFSVVFCIAPKSNCYFGICFYVASLQRCREQFFAFLKTSILRICKLK